MGREVWPASSVKPVGSGFVFMETGWMSQSGSGSSIYDVVVVGAGPAGATAAFLASGQSLRVLIVDRQPFPRPKLCGGLLTRKAVCLLQDLFTISPEQLIASGIVVSQASEFGIRINSRKLKIWRAGQPFYFVDREKFDDYLLRRAMEAGSEFIAGIAVNAMDEGQNRVLLADGRSIAYRFLLAADGAASQVRKHLVAKGCLATDDARLRHGMANAAEVFQEQTEVRSTRGFPRLYLGPVHRGYGWIFPHGESDAAGVLERDKAENIRRELIAFLRAVDMPESSKIKGHPIPYGNCFPRPFWNNIALLGDAACLADPLTGEGIYAAIRSASLLMSAWNPATDTLDMEIYARGLADTLLQENRRARIWAGVFFMKPEWLRNFIVSHFLLPLSAAYFLKVVHGEASYMPGGKGLLYK